MNVYVDDGGALLIFFTKNEDRLQSWFDRYWTRKAGHEAAVSRILTQYPMLNYAGYVPNNEQGREWVKYIGILKFDPLFMRAWGIDAPKITKAATQFKVGDIVQYRGPNAPKCWKNSVLVVVKIWEEEVEGGYGIDVQAISKDPSCDGMTDEGAASNRYSLLYRDGVYYGGD